MTIQLTDQVISKFIVLGLRRVSPQSQIVFVEQSSNS